MMPAAYLRGGIKHGYILNGIARTVKQYLFAYHSVPFNDPPLIGGQSSGLIEYCAVNFYFADIVQNRRLGNHLTVLPGKPVFIGFQNQPFKQHFGHLTHSPDMRRAFSVFSAEYSA